jgi:CHAD domain-containing protein
MKPYDPSLDPLTNLDVRRRVQAKHLERCTRWSIGRIANKCLQLSMLVTEQQLDGTWKNDPLRHAETVVVHGIYRRCFHAYWDAIEAENERTETIRRHAMRKRPRLLRRPHWAGVPGY